MTTHTEKQPEEQHIRWTISKQGETRMNSPTLIWADFRFGKDTLELVDALSETYLIDVVCTEAEVFACVGRHSPDVICFDYDYPDHSGLIALQHTKLQFPAVPILMLTQQHSEGLAVRGVNLKSSSASAQERHRFCI